MKPTIIGELNPYGGCDNFALYPAPDGCSGHRLCCLILGMWRRDYLEAFHRANLCRGKWSLKAARDAAAQFSGDLILLGAKVTGAFGYDFDPFTIKTDGMDGRRMLVLPHPSGLNRMWNEPGAFERARQTVVQLQPGLECLVGKAVAP